MKDNCNFISITDNNSIELKGKKRGDVPYYTLVQVASLLNEDEQQIRYYTNIFDDILKIEILDKHFVYTDKDVDKLEFLIKLKNKGMSIKEIVDYCDKLPLDDNTTFTKESSYASINDFLKLLKESESKELNKFQNSLLKEMKSYIDNNFNALTTKIMEEQQQQIENLENRLIEHIDNLFNSRNELINSHQNDSEIFAKCENIIDIKSNSFKEDITKKLDCLADELREAKISSTDPVLNEIRKIKDLIYNSYCVELDLEKNNTSHNSMLKKLFASK